MARQRPTCRRSPSRSRRPTAHRRFPARPRLAPPSARRTRSGQPRPMPTATVSRSVSAATRPGCRSTAADGTLSGTPAAANVGTASGIVISVSDGTASTSLPAFAITVAQTNRAPTIYGSPTTSATVGQAYTFRPTAADADGDSLTFSVRGNPAWLSINSTDGTLAGIPAAAERRHRVRHRDQRERWHGDDQPASVRHHGRADQPCTDDFRLARDQRHRRPGVHVPADRCRCRWRQSHVQCPRQPGVVVDQQRRRHALRASLPPRTSAPHPAS